MFADVVQVCVFKSDRHAMFVSMHFDFTSDLHHFVSCNSKYSQRLFHFCPAVCAVTACTAGLTRVCQMGAEQVQNYIDRTVQIQDTSTCGHVELPGTHDRHSANVLKHSKTIVLWFPG